VSMRTDPLPVRGRTLKAMTISIPDSIKELVDQEVASGTFPTAEDYIRALVEAAQKRKAQDRFEALIDEGLDSPWRCP